MTRTIWFLTGNAGKLKEAANHLEPLGYSVKHLNLEEGMITEPQVDTLEEVARAKINQALEHLPDGETLKTWYWLRMQGCLLVL